MSTIPQHLFSYLLRLSPLSYQSLDVFFVFQFPFGSSSLLVSSSFHSPFVNHRDTFKMSVLDGIIAVLVFVLILLLTFAPTSVPIVKGRSIDGDAPWKKKTEIWRTTNDVKHGDCKWNIHFTFYWSFFSKSVYNFTILMGKKIIRYFT